MRPGRYEGNPNMAEATKSKDFTAARNAARVAVLDLITDTVAEIRENRVVLVNQVSVTRALADAYRAIDGGVLPVRTDK